MTMLLTGTGGGAAAFTPTEITWKLWLETDAIVGLSNNDTVTTIPDQSGNANDAGVLAGTTLYKTNAFGTKPAIEKSTAGAMGSTTGLGITGNSDRTFFFVVYTPNTASNFEQIFFDGSREHDVGAQSFGVGCLVLFTWGADPAYNSVFTTPTPAGGAVWTLTYQGSSQKLNTWINTTPATVDQVIGVNLDTANLGYQLLSWVFGGRDVSDGFRLGAVFAAGSLLDATQIANMQNYLVSKYSITP